MNSNQKMYVRKASAGTGKTYTLAAHYIALLLQGERYQSILAVTFTNKATAEMKDRIIEYLFDIARKTTEPSTQAFLGRVREIAQELGFDASKLTDAYCQNIAANKYADLLIHYDEMRVQTIDSFLQGLLSGMVQQLDGAVGYQVELKLKEVISHAVDDLLTIGAQDPAICRQLTRYMDEKMNEGKSWDIRAGLNAIGGEIFKELLQQKEQQLLFDAKTLYAFIASLKSNWRERAAEDMNQLKALILSAQAFPKGTFDGQRFRLTRLEQWMQCIDGTLDESNTKSYFVPFTDKMLQHIHDEDLFATVYRGGDSEHVRQLFVQMEELAHRCEVAFHTPYLLSTFINDLVLMGDLKKRIRSSMEQTNTRLLAETANTLYKALKPGDADFILEKAGIRYKHIMLDEFQDTSFLQWENFAKLLTEILASQGSTLIVGDIKQSIYRWRNGDWEIMKSLPEKWADHYNPDTPQLVKNFRSRQEVVRFNLETMQTLTSHECKQIRQIYDEGYDGTNLEEFFHASNTGGYVRFRCYTSGDAATNLQVRAHILEDMKSQIERLLTMGVEKKDIMILVRTNDEAKEVKDALSPLPVTSPNCFQLQYAPTVMLLVSAMRYLFIDDSAALRYVQQYAPDVPLDERRSQLSTMALTDLTEWLIQECLLRSHTEINDLGYLNSFRDEVRQYVMSNGSDGVAFLQYWEDRMKDHSIPAVDDAGIRLMTIHASKGLEGANVFLPFCKWSLEENNRSDNKIWCDVPLYHMENDQPLLLPLLNRESMKQAGYAAEYAREHFLERVDNLNVLYVALTRAAERLFIYSMANKDWEKKKHVGDLLVERCGLGEALTAKLDEQLIGGVDDYVEQTYGDPDWKVPAKAKHYGIFSFEDADIIPAKCHSSSSRIEFRQSQDSRTFGWNIAHMDATEAETMTQAALGTLCHTIMEAIGLYATADEAIKAVEQEVQRTYDRGLIPTEALRDEIMQLTQDTVKGLAQWFTGDWLIQREQAVLFLNRDHDVEERRMDRVMWSIDRTQAIVLDYKFGKDDPKYDAQVSRYMAICRRLGAQSVQGYLWIAKDKNLIAL